MPPRVSDTAREEPADLTTESRTAGDEDLVNRAIGDELRRVRDGRGWTRGTVVERMTAEISVQTLANYELGIRPCTLSRLFEICEALDVSTSVLVTLALQRIRLEPGADNLFVDLREMIKDDDADYQPLRRWAKNRLKDDLEGTGVARMERIVVEEMATFFGLPLTDFLRYLYRFIPQRTPSRVLGR